MFILKIQGTNKIPDYLQIRDADFALVAYFRMTSPKAALTRCNLLDKMERILEIAHEMEYGKIQELNL